MVLKRNSKGDMLYKLTSRPIRLQSCYLRDEEIERATDFIRNQMKPEYLIDLEDLKTFHLKRNYGSDELLQSLSNML